ncbi:hypothetical protein Tco_0577942 [Tanacetum coccineum]
MLEMQKPPKDKHGIGYTEDIASTSNEKTKKLSPKDVKMPSVELALLVPSAREPASSDEQNQLSAEDVGKLESNILKKNDSVQITRKSVSNSSVKNVKQAPILKLSQGLRKKPEKMKSLVRPKVKQEPDEWIKDSGCSRHMTGNKGLFSSYKAIDGGQICDKKCKVLFSETGSEILKDGITIGRGIKKNGLYIMKMGNSPKDNICLTSKMIT